ncbi:MAG: hypothetical protein MJ223_01870 [Mycoplasmoidaceae bacterium]|nr:hypothetical protein [Mycoplasmoidaceae bacterium]
MKTQRFGNKLLTISSPLIGWHEERDTKTGKTHTDAIKPFRNHVFGLDNLLSIVASLFSSNEY